MSGNSATTQFKLMKLESEYRDRAWQQQLLKYCPPIHRIERNGWRNTLDCCASSRITQSVRIFFESTVWSERQLSGSKSCIWISNTAPQGLISTPLKAMQVFLILISKCYLIICLLTGFSYWSKFCGRRRSSQFSYSSKWTFKNSSRKR